VGQAVHRARGSEAPKLPRVRVAGKGRSMHMRGKIEECNSSCDGTYPDDAWQHQRGALRRRAPHYSFEYIQHIYAYVYVCVYVYVYVYVYAYV